MKNQIKLPIPLPFRRIDLTGGHIDSGQIFTEKNRKKWIF